MTKPEVSDDYIASLYVSLQAAEKALMINGPAFYMLAQELMDTEPRDITLGELAAAMQRSCERYKAMHQNLEAWVKP